MMTRRVVMMALAVSLGGALSASAQTPSESILINILTRPSRNTQALNTPVVPTTSNPAPATSSTGGTSNTTLKIVPLNVPKTPTAAECGPRPPRNV